MTPVPPEGSLEARGSAGEGDRRGAEGRDLPPAFLQAVEDALREDGAWEDVTTRCLIPRGERAAAVIVARVPCRVAGLPLAAAAFRFLDPQAEWHPLVREGEDVGGFPDHHGGARLPAPVELARVRGEVRALLGAERVALNFLQRLSGIATATAVVVAAARRGGGGGGPVVTATRKTTPGLRPLELYAVEMGGGRVHRPDLRSGILVKDNHLAWARSRGLSLARVVGLIRARAPHGLRVEVEVETPEEAQEAVAAGAEAVLLDNMEPAEVRRAVELVGGRALVEASGGVHPARARELAAAGVDVISVGAVTHSAPAADMSLELVL